MAFQPETNPGDTPLGLVGTISFAVGTVAPGIKLFPQAVTRH